MELIDAKLVTGEVTHQGSYVFCTTVRTLRDCNRSNGVTVGSGMLVYDREKTQFDSKTNSGQGTCLDFSYLGDVEINTMRSLLKEYEQEKQQVIAFIGNEQEDQDQMIRSAISKIATIKGDKFNIEIRDSNSVIFTIVNSFNTFYIKYFIGGNTPDALFSMYHSQSCLINGVDALDAVIQKVTLLNESRTVVLSIVAAAIAGYKTANVNLNVNYKNIESSYALS